MENRIQTYGVAAEIDRRRKKMTDEHINRVPLLACGPNDEVFEELVLSRTRRLRALQHKEEEDCERIATKNGRESAYWHMENAILQIITATLKAEVWMQYSKLIGHEDYKFYKGWAIGLERSGAENGDLFTSSKQVTVVPKEVRRNGDDIKLTAGALH